MLNVFVLEDDPNRIEWFEKMFGETTHTDDVLEAKEILKSDQFDLIFLDHDLGGDAYVRGKNGDGIDLARWMAEEKNHQDVGIIVHSLNKPGADNILATLKNTHSRVFRIDFVTLKYRIGKNLPEFQAALAELSSDA